MVDKVFAETGAGCMGTRLQECQTFATQFSRESQDEERQKDRDMPVYLG
jgi:hypothetical protein